MKVWSVNDPHLPKEDVVAVNASRLLELMNSHSWLIALECAGVDNWDGMAVVDRLSMERLRGRHAAEVSKALGKEVSAE